MAFEKVKRYLLDKKQSVSIPFDGDKLMLVVRSILVIALVNDDDDIKAIEMFKSRKEKEGKEVKLVLVTNNKLLAHEYLIDIKRLKWTGEPNCELYAMLKSSSFDLLYIPCYVTTYTMEYIVKSAGAKVKTGYFDSSNPTMYDFSVDMPSTNMLEILLEIDTVRAKLSKDKKV